MLVDSHCHLDDQYCPGGADAPLERARRVGVRGFVCIGVGGLAPAQAAVSLAAREPDVVATVGIHPHDAANADGELEPALLELLRRPCVVAVGEIGLDYHYDHSPRDVQREVFRRWIHIAREARLPIVVHTRSAASDTLDVLREEGAREVGGVIHCFSEDRAFAASALDLGFDISFSGIVTFKNAHAIHDVARWAPSDRILVETDSPYLAPVPKRGKPNEPAYVEYTARHLAELRGQSYEELAEQTTRNSCRLFGPKLERAVSSDGTKPGAS